MWHSGDYAALSRNVKGREDEEAEAARQRSSTAQEPRPGQGEAGEQSRQGEVPGGPSRGEAGKLSGQAGGVPGEAGKDNEP